MCMLPVHHHRITFVENCHDALVGEVREVVNTLIGIRDILRTFNFNNASPLQAVWEQFIFILSCWHIV